MLWHQSKMSTHQGHCQLCYQLIKAKIDNGVVRIVSDMHKLASYDLAEQHRSMVVCKNKKSVGAWVEWEPVPIISLGIVGWRGFKDARVVEKEMQRWMEEVNGGQPPDRIVSGGASGADRLARQWARKHNVQLLEHKAERGKHGRAAGPMRNTLIVRDCTHLLAFPGPNTKGTLDIITKAQNANLNVRVIQIK